MAKLIQISGWNPWYWPKTVRDGYDVGSSPFPPSYLPARAFWTNTFAVHCYLPTPWISLLDPFSAFLIGGGVTGSLIGVIGGLGAAEDILRERQTGSWGIGRTETGVPTVGFCMGDSYKEHAYFYYDVTHLFLNLILGLGCIDVFQRSRLKRIYVAEGAVVRFTSNPVPVPDSSAVAGDIQYILTLDVEGIVPPVTDSVVGDVIKIYKRSTTDASGATIPGSVLSYKIIKLLPNWELVVKKESASSTEEPKSGDFYKFDQPWCIEDPYMMSGFWSGAQGEIPMATPDSIPFSPYKVLTTTHICPYNEVKFIGAYVYRTVGGPVIPVAAGTPFAESEGKEWAWDYYPGKISSIYRDSPDRYFVVQHNDETPPTTPGLTGTYIGSSLKQFPTATDTEVSDWKALDTVNFARLELANGGNSARQNWHSPILTKCWLEQGGKYFAILGQPESYVIDVALKDVTGSADLDTSSSAGGKIFNQYAWMINEDYSGFPLGLQFGFLYGNVTSAVYTPSDNTTIVQFDGQVGSYGTIAPNTHWAAPGLNPNSFYARFVKTYTDAGGTGTPFKKMWQKFFRWRLHNEVYSRSFEILPDSVVIGGDPATVRLGDKVTISVKVIGDMSGSRQAGFYFDTPYDKMAGAMMPVCTFNFQQALETGSPIPTICVDMTYDTLPINVSLPANTIIGITGGTWWGLGAYGLSHILKQDGLDVFVTVPSSALGISSFYHMISQQDWIFFKDVNSNIITLRRSNLDFTETPTRSEISIGFPESTGSSPSFPITFDTTKDRVRLIGMDLPDVGTASDDEFGPSALTFQVGNTANYLGFESTGSGIFDFVALRDNGYPAGTVDYSKYKNNGKFTSPVYIYTKRPDDESLHKISRLNLGISTKDKLFVKNGSPSNISIEYVKNNQMLLNIPFFDSHHINDGEIMLIYGKNTHKFIMGTEEKDPSEWPTSESVYIIGTANNALNWGTPTVKHLSVDGDTNFQYSIMLLNSCQYLSSSYSNISERLVIILKCYHEEGVPFIGCLTIGKNSLAKDLSICTSPTDINDLSFWFRPSKIDPAVLSDPSKSYVKPEFVLTPSSTTPPTEKKPVDVFVRVIGPSAASCQITSDLVNNMGLLTSTILNSGSVAILYGAEEGIRMLASYDSTRWEMSKIILARDATSPLVLRGSLFFITPEGITVKPNMAHMLYKASLVTDSAGLSVTDIESIQKDFDDITPYLIGSGQIDSQRISGHISQNGTQKIFYYNNQNILCCLESKDLVLWKMASNF